MTKEESTWRGIVKDFERDLENSKGSAITGVKHVQGEFSVRLPELFKKSNPVTGKRQVASDLKKTLEQGRVAITSLCMTLERMVERISRFEPSSESSQTTKLMKAKLKESIRLLKLISDDDVIDIKNSLDLLSMAGSDDLFKQRLKNLNILNQFKKMKASLSEHAKELKRIEPRCKPKRSFNLFRMIFG